MNFFDYIIVILSKYSYLYNDITIFTVLQFNLIKLFFGVFSIFFVFYIKDEKV